MLNREGFARCWTRTAQECYERGCVCEGCLVYEQIGKDCRMKAAVLELVRKFGKPPKKNKNMFSEYEKNVLEVIKDGCNTFKEIAQELGKSTSSVGGIVHLLYRKARLKGWKPNKKGIVNKSLLPQFVDWVRKNDIESEQE